MEKCINTKTIIRIVIAKLNDTSNRIGAQNKVTTAVFPPAIMAIKTATAKTNNNQKATLIIFELSFKSLNYFVPNNALLALRESVTVGNLPVFN